MSEADRPRAKPVPAASPGRCFEPPTPDVTSRSPVAAWMYVVDDSTVTAGIVSCSVSAVSHRPVSGHMHGPPAWADRSVNQAR